MGSVPQEFTQAPALPPGEAAQMGGGAPTGLGAVAEAQAGPVNPHAQILARANAIDAVLKQMAELNPSFAPFARQAASAITNGMAAVSAAPQVDEGGLPPEMPGNSPVGAGMNPALG